MKEILFNKEWKYWIDKNAFALVWNIPENAETVELPHDAMIQKPAHKESFNGGNTGFRDGDVYNYVKIFNAPLEYKNKTVMLKFEGVYMNTFVYVNGQLASKNPYGYTTFYVNLDDYLRYDEDNEIRVVVRNGAMTNSRWYSGGGIYRDVYILVSDLSYIVPEGVQISTVDADEEYASINIKTELKNRKHNPADLKLENIIQDDKGNIVSCDTIPVTLFENEMRIMNQRLTVKNPCLWSYESPTLYRCITRLYEGDELKDESISTFGIRTLSVDAQRGFRVNGKTVKFRGACIHHDSGLLGAATYEEAQYRQIKILKDAGFNAVRMSHQPMAPAMLRACDRLGMYVMDESFDMWTRCKSDYDYGLYFSECWEKDITAMVRSDFNHPSVVMYSIGNEIPEIGTDHGSKLCHDISSKVKELDSTRFTLASINGVFACGDRVGEIVSDVVANLSSKGEADGNVNDFMTLMDAHLDKIVVHKAVSERLEKACAYTDIAGYNYMTARYEGDGINYPNRVIVGSETYPPEIARNWELVKKLNHVIGDFTWTGWDYIGEAGVGIPAYNFGEGGFGAGFPCQLAYSGDIDITGFRRPASYYREIVFGLRKNPYIAVQNPARFGQNLIKTPWVISDSISSWTYDSSFEGAPVIVEVYCGGDEVELLCNGTTIGRKKSGKEAGYRVLFETIYKPGKITAVSYEEGKEIGRMDLETSGEVKNINIKAEDTENTELIYVKVELCDVEGRVVTYSDKKISLFVDGGADLIGFGSGNPKPLHNYTENVTETFNGRALAVLKRNGEDKEIKITLETEDASLKNTLSI